jgi:hypothetical protein
MEMNLNLLKLAGMSILGALFHLLVKLDSKSKTSKAAKQTFSTKQYFLDEKFSIGANTVAQAIVLIWTPELVANYPALEGWVMAINALAGFAGSYLLSLLFGAASRKLNKLVEEQTNVTQPQK